MTNPAPRHPVHVPPLMGPGHKDLREILEDIQRRLQRLESQINTH